MAKQTWQFGNCLVSNTNSTNSNNINGNSSFNAHLILLRGIDLCFDEKFGPRFGEVVTQKNLNLLCVIRYRHQLIVMHTTTIVTLSYEMPSWNLVCNRDRREYRYCIENTDTKGCGISISLDWGISWVSVSVSVSVEPPAPVFGSYATIPY